MNDNLTLQNREGVSQSLYLPHTQTPKESNKQLKNNSCCEKNIMEILGFFSNSKIYSQAELNDIGKSVSSILATSKNQEYLKPRVIKNAKKEEFEKKIYEKVPKGNVEEAKNIYGKELDSVKFQENSNITRMKTLEYLIEKDLLGKLNQNDITEKEKDLIKNKYNDLKTSIYRWRHVKGDGNCFYRAVIFRYLEEIILNDDIQMYLNFLNEFFDIFEENKEKIADSFKARTNFTLNSNFLYEILLVIYEYKKQGLNNEAHKLFIKCFVEKDDFDLGLILYFRYILYKYIKENEEKYFSQEFCVKIGNLLPFEYETADGKFSYKEFYEKYLLFMFKDAEKIIIYLTPFVLNISLNVILFDCDIDCVKVLNSENDEIKVTLLNIKNHFELVYSEEEINAYKNKGIYISEDKYEPIVLKPVNNNFNLIDLYEEPNYTSLGLRNLNFLTGSDINKLNQVNQSNEDLDDIGNNILFSSTFYASDPPENRSCKKCNKTFKIPTSIPIQICQNCIFKQILGGLEEIYSKYLHEAKEAIKNGKIKQKKEYLSEENKFIIDSEEYTFSELIQILQKLPGAYSEKDVEKFLRQNFCLQCEKKNEAFLRLPCDCSFCCLKCVKEYYEAYFKINPNGKSLYCLCQTSFCIPDLNNILERFIQFEGLEKICIEITKIGRNILEEKCAKCGEKSKNLVKVEIEDTRKILKDYPYKMYHCLCEKDKLCKNFSCIFCKANHNKK